MSDCNYGGVIRPPELHPGHLWIMKHIMRVNGLSYYDLESQQLKGQLSHFEAIRRYQFEYCKHIFHRSRDEFPVLERSQAAWQALEAKVLDVIKYTSNEISLTEGELRQLMLGEESTDLPRELLELLQQRTQQVLLYYKRHLWEQNCTELHSALKSLAYDGIPVSRRGTAWLDLSKCLKMFYQTEWCLRPQQLAKTSPLLVNRVQGLYNQAGFFVDPAQTRVYLVDGYFFLYTQLHNLTRDLSSVLIETAIADLQQFSESEGLNAQDTLHLGNVLSAFGVWLYVIGGSGCLRIVYCKSQIRILYRIFAFLRAAGVPRYLQEARGFWLFLCAVCEWAKRYYDLGFMEGLLTEENHMQVIKSLNRISQLRAPRQGEEPPGKHAPEREPLASQAIKNQAGKVHYSTQLPLFSVREDLVALRYFLREKLPEVCELMFRLSFPLEQYFVEHFLSLFSGFFHEQLLFRIWDCIAFESGVRLPQGNRVQHVLVCALIEFLQENSALLLQCRSLGELYLALESAARIQLNGDEFIRNVQSKIQAYYAPKFNSNLLDALKSISMKITNSDLSSFEQRFEGLAKLCGSDAAASQSLAVKLLVQTQFAQSGQATLAYASLKQFILGYAQYRKQQLEMSSQVKAGNKQPVPAFYPGGCARLVNYQAQVKRIYLLIHDIQILNFCSKVEIHLTYSNQKRIIHFQDLPTLQIFESFNYRPDTNHLEIVVYEILSEFIVPIYSAVISLKSYLPDILYKDTTILDNKVYQDSDIRTTCPDHSVLFYSVVLHTLSDQASSLAANNPQLFQQQLQVCSTFQSLVKSHLQSVDRLTKSSELKCLMPASLPAFRSDLESWLAVQENLNLPTLSSSTLMRQPFLWKVKLYQTQQEFLYFIQEFMPEWKSVVFDEVFAMFQEHFNIIDFAILLVANSPISHRQKVKLLVLLLLQTQENRRFTEKRLLLKEHLRFMMHSLYERFGLIVPLGQIQIDTPLRYAETREAVNSATLSMQNSDLIHDIRAPLENILSQNSAIYGQTQLPLRALNSVNLTNTFFVFQNLSMDGQLEVRYTHNNRKIARKFELGLSDHNDFRFYLQKTPFTQQLSAYDQRVFRLMKNNDELIELNDRVSYMTSPQAARHLYDLPGLSYFMAVEQQTLPRITENTAGSLFVNLQSNNQLLAKFEITSKYRQCSLIEYLDQSHQNQVKNYGNV